MKAILTLAAMICVVFWIFDTDFLILDLLFGFILMGAYIIVPLVILIIVVWVIKELFN